MNSAPSPQRVAAALTREHLFPFVMRTFTQLHPGEVLAVTWYIQAMCCMLERCESGQLQRAMIWIMPRCLKSITASVAYPCWLLGRDPTAKIMVVTYSDILGRQHDEQRRQIMETDWYKRLFPRTRLAKRGNRVGEIHVEGGGQIIMVSVEGTVTGRGADYIILDDCMKAGEQVSEAARQKLKDWFSNTLATRLNDKRTGVIVSVAQRLHEDDLLAMLRDKGYRILSLPAVAPRDIRVPIGRGRYHLFARGDLLDPVRFPQEVLDEQRRTLTPTHYSAQYLQEPVALEGNLIQIEKFRRWTTPIARERFEKVVQSWDTASTEEDTGAYSVCTTWGYLAGRWFLLDIYRRQVSYPDLKRAVIALRHKWRADKILIEYASSGISLVQDLRRSGPFKPHGIRPHADKLQRLIAQTAQIEEGRVYLPNELPGLEAFLSELRAFPHSARSDQVDSLSQMLNFGLLNWRYGETEHTKSGRVVRPLRISDRPPLPPLPDFVR